MRGSLESAHAASEATHVLGVLLCVRAGARVCKDLNKRYMGSRYIELSLC